MHCNVYDVSGTQWRHAVNVDQTHYIHRYKFYRIFAVPQHKISQKFKRKFSTNFADGKKANRDDNRTLACCSDSSLLPFTLTSSRFCSSSDVSFLHRSNVSPVRLTTSILLHYCDRFRQCLLADRLRRCIYGLKR